MLASPATAITGDDCKVVVQPNETYGKHCKNTLKDIVDSALSASALGVLRCGQVLLKPALQHGRVFDPYHRLTTHPKILGALVEVLLDSGAKVSIGSVSPHALKHLEWLRRLAKCHNVTLVDFEAAGYQKFASPSNEENHYLISRAVIDAENVVNCANLQMHRRLRLAGGMKNMLNAITRYQQAQTYTRLQKNGKFCDAIVDIFALTKPALTLLDLTSVRIDQVSDDEPIFV